MVTRQTSRLQRSKGMPEKAERSNSENVPVSATAMQLFEQMQDLDFAGGVEKFLSMSPREMGEAALKAATVRKAPR